MASTPDLFSLFPTPTADSLCLSDSDTAWLFETDADPLHMQMQFSDMDYADIEIPDVPDLQPLPSRDSHVDTDAYAELVAGQDSPAGHHQASNGDSPPMPESRSTSTSSALLSSLSHSPRFPGPVEAQPHTGKPQVNVCTSQSTGSETCLAAALRSLRILQIAHSVCLSAHREAPAVQQTRKMETVLSTNKDVVAGIGPILTCCCSAKSLVQLLLLSICGNLITWNGAMISANLDQGDGPFSPASGSSADPTQAPQVRVLAQPITIGQHQLNGELARVLHNQVMAAELRILEGLVDALSRRFGEKSRSDGVFGTSPTATHMGNVNGRATATRDTSLLQSRSLSHNVHRHVISSLRMRLENTRAKIFSQSWGQAGQLYR